MYVYLISFFLAALFLMILFFSLLHRTLLFSLFHRTLLFSLLLYLFPADKIHHVFLAFFVIDGLNDRLGFVLAHDLVVWVASLGGQRLIFYLARLMIELRLVVMNWVVRSGVGGRRESKEETNKLENKSKDSETSKRLHVANYAQLTFMID